MVAGARAAVASIGVGVAGGLVGAVGTAAAFQLVPGTWSDEAQLAAFSAPAVIAAALGVAAMLTGGVAAWRGWAAWPGWIGALGTLGGGLTVVLAVGWLLFLGGLSVLAWIAWH